jgi:hypothetical protein
VARARARAAFSIWNWQAGFTACLQPTNRECRKWPQMKKHPAHFKNSTMKLTKKPTALLLALFAALAPACNKVEEAPAAPKVQAKEEPPAPPAQAAGKPRKLTAKELSEKQQQFNKLDTDKSGSLVLEEYLSIVDIPERIVHFKRLDANENGSLTFEEFSTPPHINGR